MVFDNIGFIKPNAEFDRSRLDYAPMFRRVFEVGGNVENAVLTVCGLGYGYYYINGEEVTPDLFTAPVSNYDKTLWYNRYDITDRIKAGKNIIAVICGNGWYNEGIKTAWDYDTAPWRGMPKFILSLEINGKVVLKSDESWKFTLDSGYTYNQLRTGEHFDSRLYDAAWTSCDYDDSTWDNAAEETNPPKGVFRECLCEPIRVCNEYKPKSVKKIGENKYLYDFGINMSGFARLKVNQPAGDKIILEYAECVNEDNTIDYKGMNDERFYADRIFQTDEFICCGKELVWTPKFTYHGFRYVIVTGLTKACDDTLTALFVHQEVKRRTEFECSDESLNKLFLMGIQATYSNLFYMPTDCPTREKLGWMNDAQGTTEQVLTDFEAERVYEKWWQDICDAMRDDGMLPGIVPTSGWGYEWGNGPVSEGALFEIPYRIYLHTGDDSLLKKGLPYFRKYNRYLQGRKNKNGEISYGLDDWAAPDENDKVCAEFINKIFTIKFLKITMLAEKVSGVESEETKQRLEREIKETTDKYISSDGTCNIDKQTAVAMLIYNDVYQNLKPLANQLKRLVEEKDFHHDCGMVGIRRLYKALNKCGLQEYAYKIITAKGFPSYTAWLDGGATALCERWDMSESQNHHMYSDFMSWIIKTVLGISPNEEFAGFERVDINPYFFEQLTYAKGYCDTVKGRIAVSWTRSAENITLTIDVPCDIQAYYNGTRLESGVNIINV
ncbi:MAG: family 78 glycoside hydrolase catalytic domain [Clostridiales bacterium]|nr:family 78 glycoside hydrolase catalytic domain [Clostridiales bacterium]